MVSELMRSSQPDKTGVLREREAAVYQDDLTCDVPGFIGAQKHDDRGDVFRLGDAFQD